MKKFLKQAAIVSGLIMVALFASSAVAFAQSGFLGGGAQSSTPSTILEATGGQGSIRALILQIINFFLQFLGLVAVIMIIYAGVLYITSAGGDSTEKAKKIILYAVIGILIILLSWAIVNTILGATTGQESQ